jgi:hypothetical protein
MWTPQRDVKPIRKLAGITPAPGEMAIWPHQKGIITGG